MPQNTDRVCVCPCSDLMNEVPKSGLPKRVEVVTAADYRHVQVSHMGIMLECHTSVSVHLHLPYNVLAFLSEKSILV